MIYPESCLERLGFDEVKALGHLVSGLWIAIDQNKTAAVLQKPPPRSIKDMQCFLGFASYYQNFLENYGKIANSYVNVDGNISANVFGNLGLPLIKGNKLTLQINAGGNYSKSTNITTNLENITNSFSLTNGYKLVSNLDKLDMIAGVSGTMNRATYTIGNNVRYYTIAPNIDISYLFPGNIRLQTDITYNKQTGGGAAYDTEYTLVNGYISRQFFKNRGTFKVAVNDMFNQNTGISRNAGSNSITDSNFNVLKRYYMFSFTYSLSKIAGISGAGQQGGQRTMGMPMGGGRN
ncbi:MAG: hypothetical protein EOP00_18685 [Pedobacter sp.]|nr:MAG: hypothetical protein EOP00_18685 [Pedobacter sp.]